MEATQTKSEGRGITLFSNHQKPELRKITCNVRNYATNA